MNVTVEERCDGWWIVINEDHEYAGPFPSDDDAQRAAERIADLDDRCR